MVEAYFDESGIHDGASHCVVAGFAGGANPWKEFGVRWKKLLSEHSVSDFHAKDLLKKSGPFFGWSREKLQDFLGSTVQIVRSLKLHAIGLAIDCEAFAQLDKEYRQFLTGGAAHTGKLRMITSGAPLRPYFLGMHFCFQQSAKLAKHKGIPVHVVCDSQPQYSPLATQLFQESKTTFTALETITFGSRNSLPGLQLADLAAHAFYRHVDAEYSGGPVSLEARYCAEQLLSPSDGGRVGRFDRDGLEGVLRNLPEGVRDVVSPDWRQREERQGTISGV